MALDQFAELFAIFFFHVYEFNAVAFRTDIADHGGEVDLAQAGANLELDGIANAQLLGRLQIGSAETDGFDAGESGEPTIDLGAKRRLQRDARVAARHDVAAVGACGGGKGRAHPRGTRTIFQESQGVFGSGAQPGWFGVGQAFAPFGDGAKQFRGFWRAHASQRFDGFDADKLIAKDVVLAGGDFHELRDGGHFLGETDLVDHHGDDEGMRVGKYGGKDESGALRASGVSRTSELAYGQILKIPVPNGQPRGENPP